MVRRSRSVLLPVLLLGLVLAAQPAAAYEQIGSGGIPTPVYSITEFNGTPGLFCIYENNTGAANDELDRIRVKRVYVHGPYAEKSYVGYRLIIQRNPPPHGDGIFRTYARTAIVKELGDEVDPASFDPRTFSVPEGTSARWRVILKFYWYAQGSMSNVVGTARVLLEIYGHRLPGAAPGTNYLLGTEDVPGFCRRNFHGL